MSVLDQQEPAWDDHFPDLLLGAAALAGRVRRAIEAAVVSPVGPPDDDPLALDLVLGVLHLSAALEALVARAAGPEAAAPDAAAAVTATGAPPDELLR